MQLSLNDRDAELLRDALGSYLPELRREIARTEAREYRHELVERQEMLERLVTELERAPV